jgi:hypothetical protein
MRHRDAETQRRASRMWLSNQDAVSLRLCVSNVHSFLSLLSGFLPFFYGRGQTSGFRVRSLLIRFPPSPGVEGEPFPIADGWLEGAELVVVRLTREGSVERTLTISGFSLRPESGAAAEK